MSLMLLLLEAVVVGLVVGAAVSLIWFSWRIRRELRGARKTIAEIEAIQNDRIRIANIGREITIRRGTIERSRPGSDGVTGAGVHQRISPRPRDPEPRR